MDYILILVLTAILGILLLAANLSKKVLVLHGSIYTLYSIFFSFSLYTANGNGDDFAAMMLWFGLLTAHIILAIIILIISNFKKTSIKD